MAKVYLSYSQEDFEIIESIVKKIQKSSRANNNDQNNEVASMESGLFYIKENKIKEKEIGESETFVCFLSNNYFENNNAICEFVYAIEAKKRMICVKLEYDIQNKHEFNSEGKLFVNAYNKGLIETCFDEIMKLIKQQSLVEKMNELKISTDQYYLIYEILNKQILQREKRKPIVFISYCWDEQKDEVRLIANNLKSVAEVWIDLSDMIIGETIYAEIQKGITKCDVFLCFTSKKYCESVNCLKEINLAAQLRMRIINIRMDKEPLANGCALITAGQLYMRAYEWKETKLKVDKVTEELKETLKKLNLEPLEPNFEQANVKVLQDVPIKAQAINEVISIKDENNNKKLDANQELTLKIKIPVIKKLLTVDNMKVKKLSGYPLVVCCLKNKYICCIDYGNSKFTLELYNSNFDLEKILFERSDRILITTDSEDTFYMLSTCQNWHWGLKIDDPTKVCYGLGHRPIFKKPGGMAYYNKNIYITENGKIRRVGFTLNHIESYPIEYHAKEIKFIREKQIACITGVDYRNNNIQWLINFYSVENNRLYLKTTIERGNVAIGRLSKIGNHFYEYSSQIQKYRCYDENGNQIHEFEPANASKMNRKDDGCISNVKKLIVSYSQGLFIYD